MSINLFTHCFFFSRETTVAFIGTLVHENTPDESVQPVGSEASDNYELPLHAPSRRQHSLLNWQTRFSRDRHTLSVVHGSGLPGLLYAKSSYERPSSSPSNIRSPFLLFKQLAQPTSPTTHSPCSPETRQRVGERGKKKKAGEKSARRYTLCHAQRRDLPCKSDQPPSNIASVLGGVGITRI